MTGTKSGPLLEICGISKSFGGLRALQDINIGIEPGAIHGIIGPNGAGKTTLFNVITGFISPDSGTIAIGGVSYSGLRPHMLVPLGIARTFQNIRVFSDLTVLENVLVGQHVHTPTLPLSILLNGRRARSAEKKALGKAREAMEFVGISDGAGERVKNLSYGRQRLVEFARAIAAEPDVVLLDEPAAGMNPTEKGHLLELVASLRDRGCTIVLIDHDMKLIMNVCTRITVLDHGRKIAEGEPGEIRNHPEVIRAYLGKDGGHA
ncbi:MAG: ABC transporter ATP-binding protein [Aminivibrio sp.]|jgi:branched-chain amino acid transport system ATP-binding protein